MQATSTKARAQQQCEEEEATSVFGSWRFSKTTSQREMHSSAECYRSGGDRASSSATGDTRN